MHSMHSSLIFCKKCNDLFSFIQSGRSIFTVEQILFTHTVKPHGLKIYHHYFNCRAFNVCTEIKTKKFSPPGDENERKINTHARTSVRNNAAIVYGMRASFLRRQELRGSDKSETRLPVAHRSVRYDARGARREAGYARKVSDQTERQIVAGVSLSAASHCRFPTHSA